MAAQQKGCCSLRLIVAGEASALLASMRRSGRWGGNKTDGLRDPLVSGLHRLQQHMLIADDSLSGVDVCHLVQPFCDVVSSEDTSGPLTGMAINALDKLLLFGLINPSLMSAADGIKMVADAITHARFVGTSSASDEVVLMRILKILSSILSVPAGALLSDEGICEIMQSCFRICFEDRLSELLRCYAEGVLADMIRLLFSNLSTLKEEEEKEKDQGQHRSSVAKGTNIIVNHKLHNGDIEEGEEEEEEEEEDAESSYSHITSSESLKAQEDSDTPLASLEAQVPEEPNGKPRPHGLVCVREVLRFLVSITDPRDTSSNSPRLMATGLGLVSVALEVGCKELNRFPSLLAVVGNRLCRHMIMLINREQSDLFFAALRNLFLLFEGCRQQLKLQMEWFLVCIVGKLRADSPSVSSTKKEFLLEYLIQLFSLPGFAAELYVNYDCSLYCASLCETITKLLSKMVTVTVPGAFQSTNILALECLLAVVSSMSVCPNDTSPISPTNMSSNDRLTQSAGLLFTSASQPEEGMPRPTMQGSDGISVSLSQPAFRSATVDDELATPTCLTPSQLLSARQRKKIITAGTEQFNKSPSVGLTFLQEQGILTTPLDPSQVAAFFRQNPALSKHMLGEYLGSRSHGDVLEAYVRSFQFSGVKLVDALREFLESFRLPGEAPIISHIMEMFATHWLTCNSDGYGTLFADADAVYVLCYAIMMLQTDLHSTHLRQRMSLAEFIEARRGMNNGKDYPNEVLSDIYNSIKCEEIVLPSERSGLVKEDYEWKVMLARSKREEGWFMLGSSSDYHRDVFLLCWGPAAAALSLALDSWPAHDNLLAKIMDGFRLCASAAAQYQLREVFDNLIISLSKFTTLLHPPDPSSSVALTLASELRARLSLQMLLSMCRQHGAMMREGWKNLLDCLLSLFRARLLPEEMVKVRDFLAEGGYVSLYSAESQQARQDGGLLSSFFSYNYWLLSGETTPTGPSLTAAETNARTATVALLNECGVQVLFSETKFLPEDSLVELVKALVYASRSPDTHHTLGTVYDEECAVFFMELLIIVTLENRDRVGVLLSDVTHHICSVVLTQRPCRRLRERSVVGLLQLAIRLLHKTDTADTLFHALQDLFHLPSISSASFDKKLRRQLARGMTELTHSQAGNLSSSADWAALLSLLEFAATGRPSSLPPPLPPGHGGESGDDTDSHPSQVPDVTRSDHHRFHNYNQFDLLVEDTLPIQDPESFFVTCDNLCHLVRDEACITPSNFTYIVRTVRLLSEVASSKAALEYDSAKKRDKDHTYASAALKLLDLLDTLYSRTQSVFADEDSIKHLGGGGGGGGGGDGAGNDEAPGVLWNMCWCPLLEGVARMCCDSRHGVRQTALAYLQRALLAYNLHTLSAYDWEACFLEVFFPMLSRLIEESRSVTVEESQMRACNLLCKLFLQHLPQLSVVNTFPELWLGILDFMDKYMHIEGSELLAEAIPESLKNMLLVMVTQGVLDVSPITATSQQQQQQQQSSDDRLWLVTYQRVEQFLPGFLLDLFPQIAPSPAPPSLPPVQQQPLPSPGGLVVAETPPTLTPSSSPSHSPSPSPSVNKCSDGSNEVKSNTEQVEQPQVVVEEVDEEEDAHAQNGEIKKTVSFPIVIHPPLPTPSPSSSPSSSPPNLSTIQ